MKKKSNKKEKLTAQEIRMQEFHPLKPTTNDMNKEELKRIIPLHNEIIKNWKKPATNELTKEKCIECESGQSWTYTKQPNNGKKCISCKRISYPTPHSEDSKIDWKKLKKEIRYVPLQGNYYLLQKEELEKFVDSFLDSQKQKMREVACKECQSKIE